MMMTDPLLDLPHPSGHDPLLPVHHGLRGVDRRHVLVSRGEPRPEEHRPPLLGVDPKPGRRPMLVVPEFVLEGLSRGGRGARGLGVHRARPTAAPREVGRPPAGDVREVDHEGRRAVRGIPGLVVVVLVVELALLVPHDLQGLALYQGLPVP